MNPSRIPLIAGNWKMYKTPSEAESFAKELLREIPEKTDRNILVCPNYLSLGIVKKILSESHILVGSQNVFHKSEGAFTGETSPAMLQDLAITHSLCGHSERRGIFGETDEMVSLKVKALLDYSIVPILCVGETIQEREENQTLSIIRRQLTTGLKEVIADRAGSVIIAYEPVWAIGTGKTATPEQAQEVHAFIRKELAQLYQEDISRKIPILYGGSVKPDNIDILMSQPDIDGALVGGASLKIDSFLRIVEFHAQ